MKLQKKPQKGANDPSSWDALSASWPMACSLLGHLQEWHAGHHHWEQHCLLCQLPTGQTEAGQHSEREGKYASRAPWRAISRLHTHTYGQCFRGNRLIKAALDGALYEWKTTAWFFYLHASKCLWKQFCLHAYLGFVTNCKINFENVLWFFFKKGIK